MADTLIDEHAAALADLSRHTDAGCMAGADEVGDVLVIPRSCCRCCRRPGRDRSCHAYASAPEMPRYPPVCSSGDRLAAVEPAAALSSWPANTDVVRSNV